MKKIQFDIRYNLILDIKSY